VSSARPGGVLADAPSAEMERIMRANRDAGHHFFEASTMRFFNSTLYPHVYVGRYFITGERREEHHPERFTIRAALENGHIETVGEFREYDSYEAAEDAVIEGLLEGKLTSAAGAEA
jgi:hypothetical protein